MRVLTSVVLATAVSLRLGAQQATVKIIHFSPERVDIQQAGRPVGTTPMTLSVAPGVHRLRIGASEQCIVVGARASAELVLAEGRLETIRGALPCADAWSELTVAGVPPEAEVITPHGQVRRASGGIVVRVPLPGTVRLAFAGGAIAPFDADVDVGPREMITSRARVGPLRPSLLSDTVLQNLPDEPAPPTRSPRAQAPSDPTAALVNAKLRQSILNSARPAEVAGQVGVWTFLGGAVASVVTGIPVWKDSLRTKPELRPPYHASLAITAGGLILGLSGDAIARRKAVRADCGSSKRFSDRSRCKRELAAEVRELEQQQVAFPVRLAGWKSDSAGADAAFADATAQHLVRHKSWREESDAVRAHNQRATANRAHNAATLDAWLARARAAQGVDVERRSPRP